MNMAYLSRPAYNHWVYARNEVSSQRMETEAPITMVMAIGKEADEEKQVSSNRLSSKFNTRLQCMSPEEILRINLAVIDFSSFVDYGDGLSLPAELGIARSTLGNLNNRIDYFAIPDIPTGYLRSGFAYDCKLACENVHGIDIHESRPCKIPLEELCNDLSDEVQANTLLLCRSEDLNRVMGVWYWLREYSSSNLRNIKVMKIEDFLVQTLKRLFSLTETTEDVPAFSQFTSLLASPIHDHNPLYRCPYHNDEEKAWDKSVCCRKNVLKYLDIIEKCLAPLVAAVKRPVPTQSNNPVCVITPQLPPPQPISVAVNDSGKYPFIEPASEVFLPPYKKSTKNSQGLLTPNDFKTPSSASFLGVSDSGEPSIPRRPHPESFSSRAKKIQCVEPPTSSSTSSTASSSPPPSSLEEELHFLSLDLSINATADCKAEHHPHPRDIPTSVRADTFSLIGDSQDNNDVGWTPCYSAGATNSQISAYEPPVQGHQLTGKDVPGQRKGPFVIPRRPRPQNENISYDAACKQPSPFCKDRSVASTYNTILPSAPVRSLTSSNKADPVQGNTNSLSSLTISNKADPGQGNTNSLSSLTISNKDEPSCPPGFGPVPMHKQISADFIANFSRVEGDNEVSTQNTTFKKTRGRQQM